MRTRAYLVVLACCSSGDRDRVPPSRVDQPPVLTEQQKREVAREVIQQANARIDADTAPCGLPTTIERGDVTGWFIISDFGGKTTYNYVGELAGTAGAKFSIYAATAARPGS